MNGKTIAAVIALVIIIAGMWWWASTHGPAGQGALASAHYACNQGKIIDAEFRSGQSTPGVNGGPPTPGGSVSLALSDGRTMTLRQTVSADGVRYSDGDPNTAGSETFVFWSKGNGALVLEDNQEKSYINCITVAPDPGTLPKVYQSGSLGFTLRYPEGSIADAQYSYQELGPGKDIKGVKFGIPPSAAAGTNLSPDSYLSVEEMPNQPQCTAEKFLDLGTGGTAQTLSDNGTNYSVASSTGAAAGNRYDEWVYALPGTNPCIAVRYFIHYGAIGNYPEGAVREFDEQALLETFDTIRRTLTVGQ